MLQTQAQNINDFDIGIGISIDIDIGSAHPEPSAVDQFATQRDQLIRLFLGKDVFRATFDH